MGNIMNKVFRGKSTPKKMYSVEYKDMTDGKESLSASSSTSSFDWYEENYVRPLQRARMFANTNKSKQWYKREHQVNIAPKVEYDSINEDDFSDIEGAVPNMDLGSCLDIIDTQVRRPKSVMYTTDEGDMVEVSVGEYIIEEKVETTNRDHAYCFTKHILHLPSYMIRTRRHSY